MRHVAPPRAPAELSGPKSAGGLERKKAAAFYKDRANREAGFPFSAYKSPSVMELLEQTFGHKCAYCESRYDRGQPMDVEHYRPKGGFAVDGQIIKPGYYWLAADWRNLLPSCIDCNRARKQEIGEERKLAGKANQFPIKDERRRARSPGGERREGRLLLHPALDKPERHLSFDDKGWVDPAQRSGGGRSEKGQKSIEVYALDRKGLVDARAEKLKRMQTVMTRIEETARELDKRGDDKFLAQLVVDLRKDLEADADPAAEYSVMARQAIDRFEARLLGG